MSQPQKKSSVLIPDSLYQTIQSMIADTGFKSVDDYATYVLSVAARKKPSNRTQEDSERVMGRLKALGYI